MAEPIDVLEAEARRTGEFLAGLGPDDWARPTRCPPLDLRELAVHTIRGALRLQELIPKPVAGEPEKDRLTYWGYDASNDAAVVERALAEAATRPGDAVAKEWPSQWDAGIALARKHLDDDLVLASPVGTIRLRDYIHTRILEVAIHAMDLRDALGSDPDPTPDALADVGDTLSGLLGTDPRRLGMDDVRFALAGTGRGALTAAERETLGPLADSFPLLH